MLDGAGRPLCTQRLDIARHRARRGEQDDGQQPFEARDHVHRRVQTGRAERFEGTRRVIQNTRGSRGARRELDWSRLP